jgi:hypothetical protein
MACMEAYLAYGGDHYVEKASSLWTAMQANQVTEMDADSSSHDRVIFNSECLGRTSPLPSLSFCTDQSLTYD